MPAKKPPDPNEKPQIKRFIEAAKEHGADKDDGALERVFKKIAPPKKPR
jgi:hypothetical protein